MSGDITGVIGRDVDDVIPAIIQKDKSISVPLGNGREITLYSNEYTISLDVCTLGFGKERPIDDCGEYAMSNGDGKKMKALNLSSQLNTIICQDAYKETRNSKKSEENRFRNSGHKKNISGTNVLSCTNTKIQMPYLELFHQPDPVVKEQALQGLTNTIAYLQEYYKLKTNFVEYLQKIYECINSECVDVANEMTDELKIATNKSNISDPTISPVNDPSLQNTANISTGQNNQDGVLQDLSGLLGNATSDVNTAVAESVPDDETAEIFAFDAKIESKLDNNKPVKPLKCRNQLVCSQCGKKFKAKHYYKAHMRMHAGLNPYQCKTCHRIYGSMAALCSHMIHHSDKTFVCDICGKSYRHPGNLNTHMHSHDEVKRHACPVCGHRSALKCQYITHMRTHTYEKPYACNLCNVNFTRSGGLLKHNKKKHPELVRRKIKTEQV